MKIREWELPNGKRKEINVPILASHCPFCGVSVEQPKSDNAPDAALCGGTVENPKP